MPQKKKSKASGKGVVLNIEEAREARRKKRRIIAEEKEKKENKEKKKVSQRRSLRNARRRFLCAAIFIGITVLAGILIFDLLSVMAQEKEVLAEKEALTEEKERLENELLQVTTDEYIEQQARDELRMIKQGETLYIVPDSENPKNNEPDE